MEMNNFVEAYPGSIRLWRIGFIIISIAITSFFILQVGLLVAAGQVYMLSYFLIPDIIHFFSLVFTLSITILVGVWFSMIVIFGTTHPQHPPLYWRWVFHGFLISTFIGMCWVELLLLISRLYWAIPPDPFVIMQYFSTSIVFGIVGFFIAALSIIMWRKWLKPVKKE